MSRPARNAHLRSAGNDDAADRYDVGYGKPPAQHRFQKGQSGNPKGRPKRSENKVPKGYGLDFGTQPANRMLLEEAYRTISVREGEKVIELPVIKAVFRALGVSAMKGNRLAQSTIAELVRGIEEEDRRLRVDHFAEAISYKADWERAIEDARSRGLPEPTPLPHPDDIIIDLRKAEVRYEGPSTKEEKEAWDRMLQFRDEQQDFVSFAARIHAQTEEEDEETLARRLALWQQSQALYDKINDELPKRYQKQLQDRCYKPLIAPTGDAA